MLDRELTPAERLALLRDTIARRRADSPPRLGRSMFKPTQRTPRGIPHTSFHVPTGPRHDTAPYTRNRP